MNKITYPCDIVIPHIAHKSKELAIKYYNNPLAYHEDIKDGIVASKEISLNQYGFWQTIVKINHNFK